MSENLPPEEKEVGLCCSRCGCRHFWVLRTEPVRRNRIRRRRECRHCGRRVTTYEKLPTTPAD